MNIIFIGAIIVILGGIISAIGTRMQNKASSAKSDKQLAKILELSSQNNELAKSVANLSYQNSQLANQLGHLSNQNHNLMSELLEARKDVALAKQQAIDNTFGSKEVIFAPGASSTGNIYNQSKLPVYDLKMFVTNYDELLKCKIRRNSNGEITIDTKCYKSNTKQYSCAILYGETIMDLEDYPFDTSKPKKVLIKFITKKATYYQQFSHHPKEGSAYRIIEQPNTGDYYNQYLEVNSLKFKQQEWVVVKEVNKRKSKIDWAQEFPLPVSFNLLN